MHFLSISESDIRSACFTVDPLAKYGKRIIRRDSGRCSVY